jgi:hypothetical protein
MGLRLNEKTPYQFRHKSFPEKKSGSAISVLAPRGRTSHETVSQLECRREHDIEVEKVQQFSFSLLRPASAGRPLWARFGYGDRIAGGADSTVETATLDA